MCHVLLQGEVVYVLKRISLGAEEICSFVIGDACGDVYNPYHEWKVIFPPVPKPVVTPPTAPTVRATRLLYSQLHTVHSRAHTLKLKN
jgi:sphingomyelin phosphodiesterase